MCVKTPVLTYTAHTTTLRWFPLEVFYFHIYRTGIIFLLDQALDIVYLLLRLFLCIVAVPVHFRCSSGNEQMEQTQVKRIFIVVVHRRLAVIKTEKNEKKKGMRE